MRTPAQMIALMQRETRLRAGAVPHIFGGEPLPGDSSRFAEGGFAMRTGTGYAFLYRPGEGVVIDQAHDADPAERELWLNGSVYAAVACLNGLYPLHASAVAWQGLVHAFSGASGAGKSTLVAALGQRGLPLFCDDTLLLHLEDPARIWALPGHKRLKLTGAALDLSGACAEGPVGSGTGKSYAAPPAGSVREPLELASLTFLHSGSPARFEPAIGAARFAALEDDHYTQRYFAIAQAPDLANQFALRARLAGALAMGHLYREFSPKGFAVSLDLAERIVRTPAAEPQR